MCLLSGQKAFNEFHNIVEVGAKSLVRVWLHQTTTDGACANFELFIEANKINVGSKMAKSLDEVKCQELDLPQTLNTNRYLGAYSLDNNNRNDDNNNVEQRNFHYMEKFRVDNLKNNSAHIIDFELKEPTLVRVLTTVHKHIEYDLVLREVKDGKTKKIIDSSAKQYEDSIYAQLDKGKYHIQLIFLSEIFHMQQPCQSIEMEFAMTKLKDIQQ